MTESLPAWNPLLSRAGSSLPPEAECERVVREFLGMRVEALTLQPIESGFSGASVTRIHAGSRVYALRRWPPRCFPEARILELHRFLNYLQRAGVPVAVPLPFPATAKSLFKEEASWWQLEPWLPGHPRDASSMTESECRAMMHQLAAMHSAAENYVATSAGRSWFSCLNGHVPAIQERLELIQRWNISKIEQSREFLRTSPVDFRDICSAILQQFLRHVAMVSENLKQSASARCTLFPCWRDLWQAHVLFADGQVSGFIDPAATRTDHPGTDLSRLLGSLFEDDREKWNIALMEYAQVRPLSLQDRCIIQVLDRSSVLLSGMTWIERWQRNEVPLTKLDEILQRLHILHRRMNRLSLEFTCKTE